MARKAKGRIVMKFKEGEIYQATKGLYRQKHIVVTCKSLSKGKAIFNVLGEDIVFNTFVDQYEPLLHIECATQVDEGAENLNGWVIFADLWGEK